MQKESGVLSPAKTLFVLWRMTVGLGKHKIINTQYYSACFDEPFELSKKLIKGKG